MKRIAAIGTHKKVEKSRDALRDGCNPQVSLPTSELKPHVLKTLQQAI